MWFDMWGVRSFPGLYSFPFSLLLFLERSFLDEQIAERSAPQGLHVSFINGFAIRIFCDEATFAAQ